MSDTDLSGPVDQDLQAAEYVLGVLPANQARAFEVLAMSDASIAASIAVWEDRLAPLATLVPLTAPPPVLWRRLALATGLESVIQPAIGPRGGVDRRASGRRAAVVGDGVGRDGAGRGVAAWRVATAASMAVAAGLAFLLYSKAPAGPEPLIAALSPYGGPGATFLVRVGADGSATVVAVGDTNVPQGRALELWAVTAGAAAPVSMGLLPENGRATLTVPAQPGTQLLVSQEPAGGSPTKQPTGPVVYAGKLTGI